MCTIVIFSIIYCLTLIRFIASYQKTQEALHWWSYRQSIKLFLEAETIRDNFLQETFAIRRNLEMLSGDDWELSAYRTQECLTKVENLHQSLAQLSERLFPAYFQGSLPLAIQGVLESWTMSHPLISFNVSLPKTWQYETIEHSLIVVWSLEELLKIAVPDILTPILIYINLEQRKNRAKLVVEITYPDISILTLYCSQLEFDCLSESFRFLTSGKCLYFYRNLNINWHFSW
ncbi:hypothetical protein AB0759_25315 [Scytonema tolypothrichoides VB-61278_2]|uniref:Histidine kinase n=1 Tax=Scytonema tolypothrichoides VB-61278_2 TaxID=3232314 RepID=A0ABW8WS69_9CYAN